MQSAVANNSYIHEHYAVHVHIHVSKYTMVVVLDFQLEVNVIFDVQESQKTGKMDGLLRFFSLYFEYFGCSYELHASNRFTND